MPVNLISKVLWAVAALSVLALAVVLALPLVASKMIGGGRIVEELSERTGYKVVLDGAPEISVWPRFRAVLHNVSLRDPSDQDKQVLSVERVDVDLSPMASLGGFAEFSTINLQRPVFAVARRDDGQYLPPLAAAGRLKKAIDQAGDAAVPNQQAIGRVRIIDGRVVDMADGAEIASAVNGMVVWPMSDSPATLTASATWRNEPVTVDMSIATPITLIKGGASNVSVKFGSAQANVSFSGSASEAAPPMFDGALEASTPDLAKALDWLDIHIGPAGNMGKLLLTGHGAGTIDKLSISQATVTIGDSAGSGALEFTLAGGVPNMAGTLAFERLDLQPIMLAASAENGNGPVDLRFTNQFGIDLRLSAAEAVAQGQTLTDVAATIQVRPGFAAFDVSDATVFGGTLQLGFRGEHKSDADIADLRLTVTDADIAPLLAQLGLNTDAVSAKTTFTAVVAGPVSSPATFRRTMSGTIDGSVASGSISGFDLTKLTGQSDTGGFFPLNALGGATTTIDGAQYKASLSGGVARLDKAEVETPDVRIRLNGIIPYVGRGLALTGHVERKATEDPGAADELFFIGGSWDAPFVTSASAKGE